MNSKLRYIHFIGLAILLLTIISSCFQKREKQFKHYYNLNNVEVVKMSRFKDSNQVEIPDVNQLIVIVKNARFRLAKYIPSKIVYFYDDSDKLMYKVYFSKDYKCFKIEGKTFIVNEKDRNKIENILSQYLL